MYCAHAKDRTLSSVSQEEDEDDDDEEEEEVEVSGITR
jgi:hypothetical protein